MNTIEPNYYAAGWRGVLEFELVGSNFDLLPAEIKGTVSDNNSNPTEHVADEAGVYTLFVSERSNERIVFRGQETITYNRAIYFGAISQIGQSDALWVNDSSPLP